MANTINKAPNSPPQKTRNEDDKRWGKIIRDFIDHNIGTEDNYLWAKEQLILKYQHYIAKRVRKAAPASNIPIEERIQEGMMAAWSTADKYNPENGTFATFISKRVVGKILDLERIQTRTRKQVEAAPTLFGYYNKNGDYRERSPKRTVESITSLHTPIGPTSEGQPQTLQSLISDPVQTSKEHALNRQREQEEFVRYIFKALDSRFKTPREQQKANIIKRRILTGATMLEISKQQNISESRISQLLSGIFKDLKKFLPSHIWHDQNATLEINDTIIDDNENQHYPFSATYNIGNIRIPLYGISKTPLKERYLFGHQRSENIRHISEKTYEKLGGTAVNIGKENHSNGLQFKKEDQIPIPDLIEKLSNLTTTPVEQKEGKAEEKIDTPALNHAHTEPKPKPAPLISNFKAPASDNGEIENPSAHMNESNLGVSDDILKTLLSDDFKSWFKSLFRSTAKKSANITYLILTTNKTVREIKKKLGLPSSYNQLIRNTFLRTHHVPEEFVVKGNTSYDDTHRPEIRTFLVKKFKQKQENNLGVPADVLETLLSDDFENWFRSLFRSNAKESANPAYLILTTNKTVREIKKKLNLPPTYNRLIRNTFLRTHHVPEEFVVKGKASYDDTHRPEIRTFLVEKFKQEHVKNAELRTTATSPESKPSKRAPTPSFQECVKAIKEVLSEVKTLAEQFEKINIGNIEISQGSAHLKCTAKPPPAKGLQSIQITCKIPPQECSR